MKLRNVNTTFRTCPVRKFCTRVWSPMRCSKSPINFVSKRHRQFKQFYEEVADKRYVDTHGDMEQQPSADKIRGCASNNNHQFTKKHKPDEPYILMPDAYIHDRLREERHYQLQQAAEGQSKDNLGEIPAVLLQIAQQKTERTLLFRFS